jgi:hypothetical protein
VGAKRRELFRVIAAVALAWVVLLLILGKWHRSSPPSRAAAEPNLLHYPGTEDVPEQTSPNLGLRKYWFPLSEDYPSKSVFQFYHRELGQRGWQLIAKVQPEWRRQHSKGKAYDVFRALWINPNRLFQLELEMLSEVKLLDYGERVAAEERAPGIKVYVTQRRVTFPTLMVEPETAPPKKGIELQ